MTKYKGRQAGEVEAASARGRGSVESPRDVQGSPGRLGPYILETRLGLGGMAEVYSARRLGPHGFVKRLAVKRILPHVAADPAFVSMFIQEAALAAELNHPNIVQVFDFGDCENSLYLAMERVEGTTVGKLLRAVARDKGEVSLEVALHLVASAARGLAHAHGLRDGYGRLVSLVHRDVSPGNLLVSRAGHLKLTDFGIAHVATTERHTQPEHLRGKIGYMSPEQVSGEPLTDRSDVFTLCTVLAELLLGESLFSRGTDLEVLLRIRDLDLSVLLKSRRRVPVDIRRLLLSGLSFRPESRPSAGGLVCQLEEIMGQRGLAGDGARATERLLGQYGLGQVEGAAQSGAERDTAESWGQPAGFSEISPNGSSPSIARKSEAVYRLLRTGRGPISFPELVRLCSTGVVQADTVIRCGRADPLPAQELPELSRMFSTPALQWAAHEVSRPQLQGELKAAILLPLIHSLSSNRETGMLYLEGHAGKRKKIYFVDGQPDFVASSVRSEMLGDYLVAHNFCMDMELDMGLAMMPHFSGRLGDTLVNLGVMRPVELYRAVTSQVRSRYLESFRWRGGVFKYIRAAESREETYPIVQDSRALMRDAAFQLDPSELEAALTPLWEKVLSPVRQPPAQIDAYQLPDSWQWVIGQAAGRGTVGSLFGRCAMQSGLDSEDAMRALFFGVSCQLLEAVA